MKLVDRILIEAGVFDNGIPNRYAFIYRDSSIFVTPDEKAEIINKIEKLRKKKGKGLPVIDLDTTCILGTQSFINTTKVVELVNDSNRKQEPPFVVKLHNIYYLVDGHHRTSAAIVSGISKIPVRILDLDQEYGFNFTRTQAH